MQIDILLFLNFPVLLGRSRATETQFFHSDDNRKDFVQVRKII